MAAVRVTESRKLVLEILLEYEKKGQKAGELIRAVLDKHDYLPPRDKAFIRRLAEGCMERAITLDYVIDSFASTKCSRMKMPLKCILRMGCYQLLYMDSVPASAACNESVSLAISKGFSGLKGFVNGVLRSIARAEGDIAWPDRSKDLFQYLSVYYSMPRWIVERFCRQYGEDKTEKMLRAFQYERPLCVRLRAGADGVVLARSWEELGVGVSPNPYLPDSFYLTNVPGVEHLPGFSEGEFLVQDSSSALAVLTAGISMGDTVIDLCAAPGGKSMFAAQLSGEAGKVYSFDLSEAKAEKIRENAKRLHFANIVTQVSDACIFREDLRECADVVIADLPCSGMGVMGRKADIRYRLCEEDIHSLQSLQRRILQNAYAYLKPGGRLLYSTCTISREENNENREWLLKEFDLQPVSFREKIPELLWEEEADPSALQIFPLDRDGAPVLDGFYIALFQKEEG